MIVYCVHTSEPFFHRILEMGRSIPASSASPDATTDLGSSRPRVLVLSLRVCLRTGVLIRGAFTSPSASHRTASHLSPRICCVFDSFLVSPGCSDGGTVGFGGHCCFFLFLFEDGSCERTLGFRNARDRCTVEDLRWRRSREQTCRVRFRHQERGPDHGTSVFLSCIFLLIQCSLQEVLGSDWKFPHFVWTVGAVNIW